MYEGKSRRSKDGYVIVQFEKKSVGVHRLVYWIFNNDFSLRSKLTVHHECRNKECCNPKHLRTMSNDDHLMYHNVFRKLKVEDGLDRYLEMVKENALSY